MATHVIEILNWTPVLTNQWRGAHWSVRHKLQKAQTELLFVEALRQQVPKATGKRRISLTVHGWPKGRLPDLDALDKTLLDSLTAIRLITDDDAAGVEGRVNVEIVRSKERKTVLTLEDCE